MEKIKILHLEDDLNDSELVLFEFTNAGYTPEYTRVDCESDFIYQLGSKKYDIILADYNLPTYDGIKALKYCAEKYPEIPFILVSGTLGEEIAVKMLKYGASDYLIKQNLKRLVPAVEHAINEAAVYKEKLHTEKELRSSEEKFRIITENSADAIFIVDSTGKYAFTNKAVTELLGYTQDEMLNKTITDLAPDEHSLEYFLKVFNQLIQHGKVTAELELRKKEGTIIPVDLNAVQLPDGKFYGSSRDISERKMNEKALLASEMKYRSIFENTQDVFYQIDQNDYISEISPSIKRLTGFTRDELIDKDSSVLFYDPEQKQELVKELEEKGEIWDFEFQIKTSDGNMKFVSLNAHRMFDPEGNPSGMEGSLHDIDERKHFEIELAEARDKAQESDRLKTAFLNNISHEIRTPMNAIIGFSDLLKEPGNDREKQNYFIEIITKSSNHLLSIITDIMEMSTIEARSMKLMPDQFNLHTTMDKLYKEHLPKTAEKGIGFRCNTTLPEEKAIVILDAVKLEAILNNLLTNAIKFTEKGEVNFGYILKNNILEFYVADTGIGISEDQFERIFDRFYKVQSTSATLYEGTGLGLSITKAYVEFMGGTIQLSSKPGQGTTFRFSIPFLIPESDSILMESKSENNIFVTDRAKTILIAEDDKNNFDLMAELLSGSDIRILHVKNGKDAIEICRSEPGIDLILMDLKMPFLDGYSATKKILQQNKNMKIIIQSAFADDYSKAIESGCIDFIAKPFDKHNFLSLVKKHLS